MPENPPLRVAVVDDEAPARALLREYLAQIPGVETVAECANGFEAVRVVSELHPDLLLLDVQMPVLDGFEVVELVGGEVSIVFVTAYDEYALRAFEVHAVDYLLKPFSLNRLQQALERARRRLGVPVALPQGLSNASRGGRERPRRLVVREGAGAAVIPIDELDLIQARDDYVVLRAGGREYRKQQTLAEMESILDPARFVRVHRSFVVNLARIDRIDLYAKDSRVIVLKDGSRVPLSRAGHTRLRDLLEA